MKSDEKAPNIPLIEFLDNKNIIKFEKGEIYFNNKDIRSLVATDIKIKIDETNNISFKEQEYESLQEIHDFENYSSFTIKTQDYLITVEDPTHIHLSSDHLTKIDALTIIIANDDFKNDEKVSVWSLIHDIKVRYSKVESFKDPNLKGLYLKSKNLMFPDKYIHQKICKKHTTCEDFKENPYSPICENKNRFKRELTNYKKCHHESFNQLEDIMGFFFFEDAYGQIENKWNEIIDNIYKLFMFYVSSILHPKITIIKSNEKIKVILKSSKKILGDTSPFNPDRCPMHNFIDDSYSKYLELKDNMKIDSLLRYYALSKDEFYVETSILLGSIFMEILVNSHKKKKDRSEFAYDLLNIFNDNLGIDSEKLLKIFQPKIYDKLLQIENDILQDYNEYEQKIISEFFKSYKEIYIMKHIAKYRNEIIHSGDLIVKNEDPNDIIQSIYSDLSKIKSVANTGYLKQHSKLLKKIFDNHLKNEFSNLNKIGYANLITHDLILIYIIEIILINCLDVKCYLRKFNHFNTINNGEIINYDANEYLKEFLINNK